MDCRDSNGGVIEMKVKTFDSTLSGLTESSGTLTAAGAALTGWYTYQCEKETASVEDNGATNVQNGTSVYDQKITWVRNKMTAAFRNELERLGQGRWWVAIKDSNGTAWLFGYTRGMDVTSSTNGTGTKFDDRNGYTLTFMGREPEPIMVIGNYSSLIT